MSRAKDIEKEQRLLQISELYKSGQSQREIASAVGIGLTQVWRDLKTMRREVRTKMLDNLASMQQKELAQLDMIEAEAWLAYERSKTPLVRVTTKKRKVKQGSEWLEVIDTTTVSENRVPDASFLDKALRCVSERCAILQLKDPESAIPPPPPAPTPEPTTVNITNNYQINTYNSAQKDAIRQAAALLNPDRQQPANLN